ncbi:hypothetical protein KC367_g9082 [Hortaea werneckii]|nr:hypothetical protein KC367_g9082 [Hortaea werneckii]
MATPFQMYLGREDFVSEMLYSLPTFLHAQTQGLLEKTILNDIWLVFRASILDTEHTTTWTFFGTLGGSPMQHVVDGVQAHLKRDGLLAKPKFYLVAPATTKGLAAGEMIAAIRPKAIELYFEKCLIETKPLPKNDNEGNDDEDNNDDDDSNEDDDDEDDDDSGDEDVEPNSPVQASTSGPSGSQSSS